RLQEIPDAPGDLGRAGCRAVYGQPLRISEVTHAKGRPGTAPVGSDGRSMGSHGMPVDEEADGSFSRFPQRSVQRGMIGIVIQGQALFPLLRRNRVTGWIERAPPEIGELDDAVLAGLVPFPVEIGHEPG